MYQKELEDAPKDRLIEYLDARHYIHAHLLVMSEAKRLYDACSEQAFPLTGSTEYVDIQSRINRYEELSANLCSMLAVGSFSSYGLWNRTLRRAIEAITPLLPIHESNPSLQSLRYYPSLLVAYSAGVSAVASEEYSTVSELLIRTKVQDIPNSAPKPLSQALYPELIISKKHVRELWPSESHTETASDHVEQFVRQITQELVPSERQFINAFDRFEAFLALAHADTNQRDGIKGWQIPGGRFLIQRTSAPCAWKLLHKEANADGELWRPLKAGWFGGSIEKFNEIWSETNNKA